jgi:hypothetical protein
MFQYGFRCHGTDKNTQTPLISIFSETVRPFLIKLHTNDSHREPVLSKMVAVAIETTCI